MTDLVATPDPRHELPFFGLQLLRSTHPQLRRLRKHLPKTTHHGNKLWKSSAILLDYLSEFPLPPATRVLEVGAGWGLGGIYCAKYFAAAVTALDIDPAVFPVLELQAAHNGVLIKPHIGGFQTLTEQDLAKFDVLIASDICFWDEASEPVYNLLCLAQEAGLRVIVSDPGRPPFIEVVEQLPEQFDYAFENWAVPHPYNYSGLVLDIPARAL